MQMPRAIGRANGTKELPRECFLSDSFTVGQWPNALAYPIPATLQPRAKVPNLKISTISTRVFKQGAEASSAEGPGVLGFLSRSLQGSPSVGTPWAGSPTPGTWCPAHPEL